MLALGQLRVPSDLHNLDKPEVMDIPMTMLYDVVPKAFFADLRTLDEYNR
jgi:hypothetical protein